ncbi:MAG: diguanylate cyclase, partial [Pseudomonadales bacterium]|nr:diguanylate cyclase [Pseudomonadales bacterium]
MALQFTPFALPSLVAVCIAIALMPHLWRHRAAPRGLSLVILMIAVTWWSAGQILGTLFSDLDGKFLAAKIQYPGVVVVPTAWFLFCLQYTGELRTVQRYWPVLTAPALIALGLALTNDAHGWIWASARLVEVGEFVAWEIEYGSLFPFHRWWSYLLVSIGTLSLLKSLLASPWHRRRAMFVIAAPLFTLTANLVYLLPDSPFAWLDLTPTGFMFSGAILSLALRSELLDLVPLSRERVVHDMNDALFVLGPGDRVLDMNPAAERLVARGARPESGKPIQELLPLDPALLEQTALREGPVEQVLRFDDIESAWQVTAFDLHDPRGGVTGRALMFQDTTERWRALRALHETTNALTAANGELRRLVTLDPVTRTLQRSAFLQQVQEEIRRARRMKRGVCMVLLRLHDLAGLNARAGSKIVDQVLRALAQMVETVRRDGDILGRTGAADFALLIAEAEPALLRSALADLGNALEKARFRDATGQPLSIEILKGTADLAEARDAAYNATGNANG